MGTCECKLIQGGKEGKTLSPEEATQPQGLAGSGGVLAVTRRHCPNETHSLMGVPVWPMATVQGIPSESFPTESPMEQLFSLGWMSLTSQAHTS